ncbi:hypothetical protein MKW98_028075 [Papaver atlanticum]|uniref:Uncharacterized protein n=1 Tax=Papaver atlanticum TaxID=357466 RepID=A0AAD4SYR1_9MAGN|nr:hypothetical protein MKW98_028075 [Papaver atlanticum]
MMIIRILLTHQRSNMDMDSFGGGLPKLMLKFIPTYVHSFGVQSTGQNMFLSDTHVLGESRVSVSPWTSVTLQ